MIALRECWVQLSKHIRDKIRQHHPDVSRCEDLSDQLTNLAYLLKYRHRLSQDETTVLHWFAIHRGEDWLSLRELQEGELPLLPVPFRFAFTRLRQRGFLFSGRLSSGETVVVLPSDIREAWLAATFTDKCPSPDDTEVTRSARPGILHDLFHFLTIIDHGDMEWTGQGNVHKRSLQKVNSEIEMADEAFDEADWLLGNQTNFRGFDVVFTLAQRSGFIVEEQGQPPRLNRDCLQEWLKHSVEEATRTLYALVRAELLRKYPRKAAVLWWMEQQSGWVALRDMGLLWMAQMGETSRDWEAFMEWWKTTWLEPLHALGWIDWGEGVSGTAWRWSVFSPYAESLQDKGKENLPATSYVQPNFEWLLPLYFPLDRRWQAAQFADLLRTDHMCTYDINPNSIKRAIKKGWTADEMIHFLKEHSVTPIPQNVDVSIREWARDKKKIHLERVAILTCEDTRLAQRLMNCPDFQEALKRKLGEKNFLIEERAAKRIAVSLVKSGYHLIDADGITAQDVFHSRKGHRHDRDVPLRVSDDYPQLEESVPALLHLPKLWTSHMRRYHPSTLRQLIQRAVDMQLELEWSSQSAEERVIFRPTRLFTAAGGWRMEGVDARKKRRQIPLTSIGRVRIRMP